MKKKDIRSNVVKDSLLDYETLAKSLKENTESAVRNLLSETVRDTYAKLLAEGEDDSKDYEEEEVEDTELGSDNDAEDLDGQAADGAGDGQDGMDADLDDAGAEGEAEGESLDAGLDGVDDSDEGGEDEGWAEFDKYKNEGGAYDLTNANDEDIVKVYKLMKDDDSIIYKKDGDNIKIQDNDAGTEYLISLGEPEESETPGMGEMPTNEYEDMNESMERTYELVLEYDSNVGYTDNYQKKDVMTNPGMSEPGKNVNDWDKGIPHGTEKPWSGYPGKKSKADKPFNAGKGKQVEEQVEECGDIDAPIEEQSIARVGKRRMTGVKSPVPNSVGADKNPYHQHHVSVAGEYKGDPTNEAVMRKINKAITENKKLKGRLVEIMDLLKEAAVTNRSLGNIIKLVTENATTKEEKQNIYDRFKNEAKTVQDADKLYESLTNELKSSKKFNMNESEDKSLNVEGSQRINETKIYRSPDVLDSLDLMHRVMKM